MDLADYSGKDYSGRKNLSAAGCDLVEIAASFGTPYLLMDEALIRQRCRVFARGLKDSALNGTAYYAAENMPAQAVLRIVRQEGLGGSASTLHHAHALVESGFDPREVVIHASGIDTNEMMELLKLGDFKVVLDNIESVVLLSNAAAALDITARAMIRINPCVNGYARTRDTLWGISPGGRFGITVDDGEALRAVKMIKGCANLRLVGFHAHAGSQVDSYDAFHQILEKMTDLAVLSMFVTGVEIEEFNVGGGFAIRFAIDDNPPEASSLLFQIAHNLRMICERKGMGVPRVSVEPGRAIVQEAGTLVTRVLSVKRQEGFRPCAILDTRAPRSIDPVLSARQPEFVLANRPKDENADVFVLADRSIEPDGVLCWDAYLPELAEGDLVAQFAAGVCPWSERSVGSPLVLIAQYGNAQIIVERPNEKYMRQLDRVPNRLNR